MTDDIFRDAYEAFAGPERRWISDPSRGMPQYIAFKFKDKHVVCKITFLPGKKKDEGVPYNCPKAIRIEGSNDPYASYNPIKRVEGKKERSKMVSIDYWPMS